jgi:hypothetical protein
LKICLIHIAPELPPTIGGVADYTAILSQQLVEVSDGSIDPVLIHAGRRPAEDVNLDFPVEDLSGQCSASALEQTIERLASEANGPAVVLLEYSGYGYSDRGVPFWLVRGLQQSGPRRVPLITMFHELYATGPVWSSAFWLSPLQRFIATKLAGLSDAILTNRVESQRWLRQHTDPQVPIRLRPVFSNVGEPESVASTQDRLPRIVVFGNSSSKTAVYNNYGRVLEKVVSSMHIDRVIDIGPSCPPHILTALDLPLERKGFLPAKDLSDILRRTSLGILCYPLSYLAKSGVWAAYAAHGVPTAVAADREPTELLKEGHHFALLPSLVDGQTTWAQLSRLGRRARGWYDEYAHSQGTAESVLELLDAVAHSATGST